MTTEQKITELSHLDVKAVFDNPKGRRLLTDIHTILWRESVGDINNPNLNSLLQYIEGRRSLLRDLELMLNIKGAPK